MAVSLQKGEKIELKNSNGEPMLQLTIGLGWDVFVPPKKWSLFKRHHKTPDMDCDASALLLQNGKILDNADIIYFANLEHPSGAVVHIGDNETGEGDGDDEQITVKLDKLPAEYDKLVLVMTIYQASLRDQHMGLLQNAFIRLVDDASHTEICRFDLNEAYKDMKGMIFGEIIREPNGWTFHALGEGIVEESIHTISLHYK